MEETVETLTTRLPMLEIVARLKERDGLLCQHPDCGKPMDFDGTENGPTYRTVDHWIPQSYGLAHGWTLEQTWAMDNLKLMHKRCNAKKADLVPNEDGTLPPRAVKVKAVAKAERPAICDTCMSGRILLVGETCPDCGSGPQPAVAPRSMQMSPKDCDHSTFHCWMCFLGFVTRTAAIVTVLDGEYLDE
jgi:hypothetical protein